MGEIITSAAASPARPVDEHKTEDDTSGFYEDVLDTSLIDPVLTRKMALVNGAIDKIGMTPFQWKLFFLNGFGYSVDSVSQPDPDHGEAPLTMLPPSSS
jgi:hypothetical protein